MWLHRGDPGSPWQPVNAVAFGAKRRPVLGLTAVIGDVTGDASDDALVFAETGGSGGCGTSFAIDIATGARVFDRNVCDTRIVPSTDPVGLVVTEAVFAHGDPHCCPSAHADERPHVRRGQHVDDLVGDGEPSLSGGVGGRG